MKQSPLKPKTPKKQPKPPLKRQLIQGEFYVQEFKRQGNYRPQPLQVYMSIDQMKSLGFKVMDFVYIYYQQNRTFGYLWPCVVSNDTILLGSQLQRNCKLDLDQETIVRIESITTNVEQCYLVQLIPISHTFSNDVLLKEVLIEMEYVMDGLEIECVVDGISYWFRVSVPGEKERVYSVKRSTQINISLARVEEPSKGFEAIGGLDEQIQEIKQMIEKPLLEPDVFLQHGLKPPRGLLLYGPPGTGKTMIARAVANNTKAHVIAINGPEIVSKYYGETEQKLLQIFEEAKKNEPCIIFFDEIDSVCPKRDDSSDLERRVVGCLLSLLDGVTMNRVFVIGTTNLPDTIDPALRRPGRFDKEFEIGIPDMRQRWDILKRMVKGMKHLLSDDDVESIARATHGYVGADLAAVCREAGLVALKRQRDVMRALRNSRPSDGRSTELDVKLQGLVLSDIQEQDKKLAECDELAITMQDMTLGMSRVKPSVVREVLVQVPKVHWSDIGGQEDIKQRLKEAIEWPLKNPELFQRFNIRPPKGILLYGPPGCSKTLMAKALATESGLNFLAVKGPELFNKWVGESEKAVQRIFKKARQASPSIIFFDEIDALAVRRSGGDSSVADRVLSQILSEMDGIEPLVNVTVVAATNRPDILDSALLRPGRIDAMLYVEPPNESSRKSIFENKLKLVPTLDVNVEELAKRTDGFSGAETVQVVQSACLLAMKEGVKVLESKHFEEAIRGITKRITPEMIQFYEDFRERSGLRSV